MKATRVAILSFTFALLFCKIFVNQAQSQVVQQKAQQQKVSFPSGETFKNSSISYKLIPAVNNTSWYDILVDNHMKIHQLSVPGLPGNDGFKTKAGAEKVAGLVISKMKKG